MISFDLLLKKQQGYVLLLMLIEGLAVISIVTGIITLAYYNLGSARRSYHKLSSVYVAEAGLDNFMYNINLNGSYSGTNSACPISGTGSNPTTFFSNVKQRATFETCAVSGSVTGEKIVYSTAKIYEPASSATPAAVHRLRAVVNSLTVPGGKYGVQTGPGGLVMLNQAAVVNGPVYAGGYIILRNQARIGSVIKPIEVLVANQRCPVPADATWPTICTGGSMPNPITIDGLAHVYGNVRANGQVDTAGMSDSGLVASAGVGSVGLPDYDRAAHKAAVTTTMTGSSASCSKGDIKIWPANVHITGDVSVKNCLVTALGNVWIDGNLTVSVSGIIRVSSTAVEPPVIMVDGSSGVDLDGVGTALATNLAGVGFKVITYHAASCTTGGNPPECASVTGNSLYSSMDLETVKVKNKATAAGSILYARWTALTLTNCGAVGQVLGQKITLDNNGDITFGTATGWEAGGETIWNVNYYQTLKNAAAE